MRVIRYSAQGDGLRQRDLDNQQSWVAPRDVPQMYGKTGLEKKMKHNGSEQMRTPGIIVFLMVVITTGMALPAMAEHEYNVVRPLLGGVTGGVLGSVLGSTIGNDKGKKIGAGVGAALGLLAGHAVARREHARQRPRSVPARQMPRSVSVPHALHVPKPRIQPHTMTLNCKIIDHAERIYECRD